MIIILFICVALLLIGVVLLIREIQSYLVRTRANRQHGTLNQTLASPKVNWRSLTWLICLTLLCLGIVAYGYYPQMTWSHLSYHSGRKVGEAVILWLVFSVTLGRKQGYMKGALSFVLIVLAGYTGALISYTQGKSQEKQFKIEARKLVNEWETAQTLSPQTQRETTSAPAPGGEAAEITDSSELS